VRGSTLTIDFPAVPQRQHNPTVIFDLADEPIIPHAVFPKLPKLGTVQRFCDAAWIIQLGYSFLQEFQDASINGLANNKCPNNSTRWSCLLLTFYMLIDILPVD